MDYIRSRSETVLRERPHWSDTPGTKLRKKETG